MAAVRIERIDSNRHEQSAFCCDDPVVDDWLGRDAVVADRQAGVAIQEASDGGRVVGCYRLGSFQVQAAPPVTSPRLRSWDRMSVPAILVSRLGVDRRWQGRGLGTSLMWHALGLAVAIAPGVGARLVVADGGTDPVTGFLIRFAFRAFDGDPRWCYLLVPDVAATISARETPLQRTTVPR